MHAVHNLIRKCRPKLRDVVHNVGAHSAAWVLRKGRNMLNERGTLGAYLRENVSCAGYQINTVALNKRNKHEWTFATPNQTAQMIEVFADIIWAGVK